MKRKICLCCMLFVLALALTACASKSEKLFDQAKKAYAKEEWESAITLCQDIITNYGGVAEVPLAKALLADAEREKHLREATDLYGQALSKHTEHRWSDAIALAEQIIESYSDTPEKTQAEQLIINCTAGEMRDEADQLREDADYKKAISKFEEIIKKYGGADIIAEVEAALTETRQLYAEELYDALIKKNEAKEWGDVISLSQDIEKLYPESDLAIQAKMLADQAEVEKKEERRIQLIATLQKQYGDQNWQGVSTTAAMIIKEFPNSAEAGTAKEYKATAEKKIQEAAIAAARDIIRVSLVTYKMNRIGGAEVYFNFTNNSSKTIKYLTFGVSFYNAVGDLIRPDYANEAINYCSETGPYAKGEGLHGYNWCWGPYYSWDIASVELVYLSIEYTDGTTVTLNENQLEYVQY